jgi:hypothetical protein
MYNYLHLMDDLIKSNELYEYIFKEENYDW